jgi:hypothetical protein
MLSIRERAPAATGPVGLTTRCHTGDVWHLEHSTRVNCLIVMQFTLAAGDAAPRPAGSGLAGRRRGAHVADQRGVV